MKKLVALILVCMLCAATGYAAEWVEGRSASQPYAGVPEVKLDKTMGYIMLFPRTKMPAERFCDILEIYLPREDLALGEGSLTLFDENGEVAKLSFADADSVELRPLEESELEGLMWGGGMCIEVHLPVSLRFDTAYYVLMDENCFSAAGGKVHSLAITSQEAWVPVLSGDYGISGLYYSAPAEKSEDEEEEEAEPADAPAEEAAPIQPKTNPEVGDSINFDLVMGGDAKYAVMYSENDTAYFETLEYTESGSVTGTVTGEDLDWGVVFLDEQGAVLDVVDLK